MSYTTTEVPLVKGRWGELHKQVFPQQILQEQKDGGDAAMIHQKSRPYLNPVQINCKKKKRLLGGRQLDSS